MDIRSKYIILDRDSGLYLCKLGCGVRVRGLDHEWIAFDKRELQRLRKYRQLKHARQAIRNLGLQNSVSIHIRDVQTLGVIQFVLSV